MKIVLQIKQKKTKSSIEILNTEEKINICNIVPQKNKDNNKSDLIFFQKHQYKNSYKHKYGICKK